MAPLARSCLLGIVTLVLGVGCRPRDRDDVPRETRTRSAEVERRVEPSDPQVPVIGSTTPAPSDPDRPAVTTEPASERADVERADAGRPSWVPNVDRLSIVSARDRDRNMGILDAGAEDGGP